MPLPPPRDLKGVLPAKFTVERLWRLRQLAAELGGTPFSRDSSDSGGVIGSCAADNGRRVVCFAWAVEDGDTLTGRVVAWPCDEVLHAATVRLISRSPGGRTFAENQQGKNWSNTANR